MKSLMTSLSLMTLLTTATLTGMTPRTAQAQEATYRAAFHDVHPCLCFSCRHFSEDGTPIYCHCGCCNPQQPPQADPLPVSVPAPGPGTDAWDRTHEEPTLSPEQPGVELDSRPWLSDSGKTGGSVSLQSPVGRQQICLEMPQQGRWEPGNFPPLPLPILPPQPQEPSQADPVQPDPQPAPELPTPWYPHIPYPELPSHSHTWRPFKGDGESGIPA